MEVQFVAAIRGLFPRLRGPRVSTIRPLFALRFILAYGGNLFGAAFGGLGRLPPPPYVLPSCCPGASQLDVVLLLCVPCGTALT